MSSQTHAAENRILVLDDEPDVRELLDAVLSARGYAVQTVGTAQEALALLENNTFDCVLLDLRLGATDGLQVCEQVIERHPAIPVVVLTGHGSMETAVGAMRAGAYDFATKPVDPDTIDHALRRAVSHHHLTNEVLRLRAEVEKGDEAGVTAHPVIGDSPALKRCMAVVNRVADSDAPVLITGESGTGKELIARALHDRSDRREEPFVAVNCAAIPANLLESELFGHVRGAFTDAKTARRGIFLEAGSGTVFLDEIGELPVELQPKLLRALQERTVRGVGDTTEHPFKARVLAATNRDLEHEIDQGRFREDLYYRINVIPIEVPKLTQRGNDVLLLAQHMLDEIARRVAKPVHGLTPEAAAKLLDYNWPGNVRELQNAMERAVALAQYDQIAVGDLPDRIRDHRADRIVLTDTAEHMPTLAALERRYVEHVLSTTGGNKSRASQILGLDRRTLYRKLERYERHKEKDSENSSRRGNQRRNGTQPVGF